ncbi:MAG: ATP-binding protein [Saprospiraceae bacterium]|nr:ATP-binding protein [Saprospiraceae bacterium]
MQQDIETLARQLANGLSVEQLRDRQNGSVMAANQQVITKEQSEKIRAYWDDVFSRPERRSPLIMTCATSQEMEYEEARRKVWRLLQLRAAHISMIERDEFEWVLTDHDKENLQNLTRYFVNDSACKWSLSKGLFLYGAPGTGKTEFMQAFERFTLDNELKKQFQFTSLSTVYTRAKAERDYDPIKENIMFSRCFDEFCRYVGPVTRFGESLDITESLIEQRYERFKRYGQLTHFVANTTPGDALTNLSDMAADRLREMCTPVLFSGESKRK